MLGFFNRKPWIMEVRDLWPDSIKAVGAMKESVVLKYFSKEEKWCYSSAKKIVVVTNSFKREIAKKGIPEDKIFVIKNGANTELFKPREKSQELLRKLGLEGKRVLGYVGTLGMAHKIDFLIDCVKGLDDYALMILGNGAEKENIQQKIESEGIKNVVLLDSVSKNEVAEYIALQDAALVNLRKSSLFTTVIPSKIFETASMRIPIMLGVDGEAREMVEEFGAGLFYEPENREDFLEKLNTLFSSPEVYKNCCDGGEKLAAAYDRKRLAAEMLEIISK
jgi:glycosyltransferase involved in cell wall biosynthesis